MIKVSWLEEFSFCEDDIISAENKEVKGGLDHITFRNSVEGSLRAEELRTMGKK